MKYRRKKGKSTMPLVVVAAIVIAVILIIAHEDSKKVLVTFISPSKPILSQDLDKEKRDMSVHELFEPTKAHASFATDNRFPEEDKKEPNEIKHEIIEALRVTDSFEEGLEPEKEIFTEKEDEDIDSSNELNEEVIADDQYASQVIPTIPSGSFFEIGRFVIAGSINGREPFGIVDVFSSSTEKVYCFLEARDITENTAVSFVWYHEDNEMDAVELPIYKGSRWRTHSSKKIGNQTGDWRVELQDVNGSVLETATFTVE
jgi:hypothetical protein